MYHVCVCNIHVYILCNFFVGKLSLSVMSGVSPVSSHSPDEVLTADLGSVDTKVEQSTYEPAEFSIEEV